MTPAARRFIANEAGSAAVLLGATLVALIWANSPWSASYGSFWATPVRLDFGRYGLDLDLQDVVNERAHLLAAEYLSERRVGRPGGMHHHPGAGFLYRKCHPFRWEVGENEPPRLLPQVLLPLDARYVLSRLEEGIEEIRLQAEEVSHA